MPLSQLVRLCPPPRRPYATPTTESEVDALFEGKFPFPRDYIDFCKTYGSGKFQSPDTHEIFIFNLFDPNFPLYSQDVTHGIKMCFSQPAMAQRLGQMSLSISSFVPLGADADRRDLAWITNNDPTKWTIMLIPYEDDLFELFQMGLTDFLAGYFSGSLHVTGWESRLKDGRVQEYTFVPFGT
jgi:hypothetical protein